MKKDEVPELVSKIEDVEMQSVGLDRKSKFEYTPCVENLIFMKADECAVLAKIHLKCHEKYKAAESYYNIPIITITALVGFASAVDIKFRYMNIVIGLLSLFVSLLKSYFSYLQISQKNENHRVLLLAVPSNRRRNQRGNEPFSRHAAAGGLHDAFGQSENAQPERGKFDCSRTRIQAFENGVSNGCNCKPQVKDSI